MAGHIKLGKFADVTLRDYVLIDPTNIQSATANPYAARVSAGGPYSALDTFNDWTINNWSMGVGHADPETGQKFSIADSRYPSYLMPPPWFKFPLTKHVIFPDTAAAATPYEFEPTLGKRYAVSFLAPTTGLVNKLWIYASLLKYGDGNVGIYGDDGTGKPGAFLKSFTFYGIGTEQPIAYWQQSYLPSGHLSLVAGTRYHIAFNYLTPTYSEGDPGWDMYMPTNVTVTGEKCHSSTDNGATWALEGTGLVGFRFLIPYAITDEVGNIRGIFTTSSSQYVWYDNSFAKVVAGELVNKLTPTTIYGCTQDGDYIYVAYGTGYYRYNTSTDTYDTYAAIPARKFLVYGGYLWRATDTDIYYTGDEVYWTTVGGISSTINGMAGLSDSLYFSTKDGLYMVAPGDVIVQASVWPQSSSDNGVGMVAWESALYIPLIGGSVMRYDSSGAIINVGINAKCELPKYKGGSVTCLYPTNYFLFAHVSGSLYPSLWVYSVDGWHCLGYGPQYNSPDPHGAICMDSVNGYLYWGTTSYCLQRTRYDTSVNNPANLMYTRNYAPDGWVEYDKFYGGYRSLQKDFDRIYIDTEQPGQHIIVYWRDPAQLEEASSPEAIEWRYLGTVSAEGETEIQFPPATRPTGNWIKLGFRISTRGITNYLFEKALLRGVSLKYSTNVADRWRWVLPIEVSGNQQMPDGSINTYTMAQQKAHLEELIAETAPLQFTDIDGTAYTVKVTGASRNLLRYDWKEGSAAASVQWAYTLTLEEIS